MQQGYMLLALQPSCLNSPTTHSVAQNVHAAHFSVCFVVIQYEKAMHSSVCLTAYSFLSQGPLDMRASSNQSLQKLIKRFVPYGPISNFSWQQLLW